MNPNNKEATGEKNNQPGKAPQQDLRTGNQNLQSKDASQDTSKGTCAKEGDKAPVINPIIAQKPASGDQAKHVQ
ncbi:MAG: hypothetical protein HQM15_11740 [Deltaproteobacteria bacterium]|nr:hypothetical protein [Deltaproteobacteria bacterium]